MVTARYNFIIQAVDSKTDMFQKRSIFMKPIPPTPQQKKKKKKEMLQCYTQSRAPGCTTSCAADDGGG